MAEHEKRLTFNCLDVSDETETWYTDGVTDLTNRIAELDFEGENYLQVLKANNFYVKLYFLLKFYSKLLDIAVLFLWTCLI